MFIEQLGLGRPADISARMDLIDSSGNVVYDKEGSPGWLEFWGPEAEPVRRFRKHVAASELLDQQMQARGGKLPTKADMAKKVENYERMTAEGLAVRLKDWRLVSIDGEVIDVPPTKENALQLFSSPDYAFLRYAATEFVGDASNFFTTKPDSLSDSGGPSSDPT